MISLILPPKDQISRAAKMLSDEFGTASNIKSRVNRLSVLSAITSTQQRLKLFSKARARPPRPLHPSSSPLPRALGGCQRAPSPAGHGPSADLLLTCFCVRFCFVWRRCRPTASSSTAARS